MEIEEASFFSPAAGLRGADGALRHGGCPVYQLISGGGLHVGGNFLSGRAGSVPASGQHHRLHLFSDFMQQKSFRRRGGYGVLPAVERSVERHRFESDRLPGDSRPGMDRAAWRFDILPFPVRAQTLSRENNDWEEDPIWN